MNIKKDIIEALKDFADNLGINSSILISVLILGAFFWSIKNSKNWKEKDKDSKFFIVSIWVITFLLIINWLISTINGIDFF